MNYDVTGYYRIKIPVQTMFLNKTVEINGHNLITQFGESFFMNRCINNEFGAIEYLALGNGSLSPRRDDQTLRKETSRHRVKGIADLNEKQIILSADFEAKEVIGTSEIGVFNNKLLISHDIYEMVDDGFIGISGQVHIEYIYQFTTGSLKGGWNESTIPNVFYSIEPNTVIGVYERNSNSWYTSVDSLEDLEGNKGAYFYDTLTKNLYIRPKREGTVSLSDLINEIEIIVQVK